MDRYPEKRAYEAVRASVGRVALGAACVVFEEGRVLLVRHTYGPRNWELPGGVALPGEDPAATARRELREETGIDMQPAGLTGLYYETSHELGPFLHAVFRVDGAGRNRPWPCSDEVNDVAFWPLDALPRPLYDFTARRIADAETGGPIYAVVAHRRVESPDSV